MDKNLTFIGYAGIQCVVQVHLPLVLQPEVSVTEDAHEDAGAHVIDPGFGGAHGDLNFVTGLLIWMFRNMS